MSDSFTETTTTGWFSRIGESIKGILVGLVMVVAAFPVLFMNEGCAVKIRKTLDQGSKEFVKADATTLDPANEGKLIHITGKATSTTELQDPVFHVKVPALKLTRVVEMFQWEEKESTQTKKKLGGGEEKTTTYTYSKVWHEGEIDSSKFKKSSEHTNPRMRIQSQLWSASPITVGAYTLNNGLVSQISSFAPLHIDQPVAEAPSSDAAVKSSGKKKDKNGEKSKKDKKSKRKKGKDKKENATPAASDEEEPATAPLPSGFQWDNGGYYYGTNLSAPQIGDLKVSFKQVTSPTEVSIVAQQVGKTFEPFIGKSGSSIEMLAIGNQSAATMFENAQNNNKFRTWLVRGGGFLLMFFGFSMLFKPLSVVADVLPIAGTVVGVGTGIFAFLLSAAFSLCTIAMAWIFYRPMIGVPLLIGAVVAIFFLIKKVISYKKSQS